ncbi:hypothetical protein [Shinella sp.]|jgi:hypothetical protein|uniref:hypothetical protein n=1 Tax=Shinella sp. TaxID=1870904 RepID=UPI003F70187D
MSDDIADFTDEQHALMNALHEAVHSALYSDALLAFEVVLMELLCAGAPSKADAMRIAGEMGERLTFNVDLQFDEIHEPVEKVILQ